MDNKKFLDLDGLRAYHNLVFDDGSNGYEYVDLGLPSGICWATCNVGATKPENSGLYFQWGSTTGYTVGSGYNFSSNNYPQSNISDTLTVEQDAARVINGGKWFIPSSAMVRELYDNSDVIVKTINGIVGRLFTSKINNKSVFFPFSGFYEGTTQKEVGKSVYFWGRQYYSSNSAECAFSNDIWFSSNHSINRSYGIPIRGVLVPTATKLKPSLLQIDTASTSKDGLMSSVDKTKLDGIAAGANNYTHPTYTSKSSGLYKITVNDTGHVSAATTVTKSDITALGIPAQDTQYTHPTYTSKSNGLYKITVDGTGHVSAATAVAKSDITALGIPSTNTTYSNATTSAAGLMSSDDKTKLNGIATGANAYTHPSYTAKSSGLYKITVNSSGHVSAATAVTKTDITNLGIPSTNTTYSVATTSSNGLMSSTDKTTLNNLSTQVGNIQTALNNIING